MNINQIKKKKKLKMRYFVTYESLTEGLLKSMLVVQLRIFVLQTVLMEVTVTWKDFISVIYSLLLSWGYLYYDEYCCLNIVES